MQPNENTENFGFNAPSLPKGGGTISGSGGAFVSGGPDSNAGWSVPLPATAARGVAPSLALSYSSAAGNSPFGMGWNCALPAVRLQTRFGTPHYDERDVYTGPDGEALLASNESYAATTLPFDDTPGNWVVTRYLLREDVTSKLERWQAADAAPFWILYGADGGLALFGWSPAARLADPLQAECIAEWYLEESVTPSGEHIIYRWRQEDDADCQDNALIEDESVNHPHISGCYLTEVYWGIDRGGELHFLIPEEDALLPLRFLFFLSFSYVPSGCESAFWPLRADPFSDWRYGFEHRTRRLCHGITLNHRINLLQGGTDSTPEAITSLLLTYESTPQLTLLLSVQQFSATGGKGSLALPPQEFDYSRATQQHAGENWFVHKDLNNTQGYRWQLIDLLGEGIPGLLYQLDNAWWYRPPVRDSDRGGDALCWGEPQRLPASPQNSLYNLLLDLNGDGYIEWLTATPSAIGYYTLTAEGKWSDFIPLALRPGEFGHPLMQFVDLTGGGLQDLALIGPKSVRLCATRGEQGWGTVEEIMQDSGVVLPGSLQARDRLIVFTDFFGSGRPHLATIAANSVTCWPSCGHGRFAAPVTLKGFDVEPGSFSPERIWLADTDGTGSSDILYLDTQGIHLYLSKAGNGFYHAATLPAPEGVRLDPLTCQLQVADIQGLGTASLVLTCTSPTPQTWIYHLNLHKPWLLTESCNNIGSRTELLYRSSAQAWLDEKVELTAENIHPVCRLPFPVHMLTQTTLIDDITGLRLGSEVIYRRGVWDSIQREFRGFTRLIQRDTHARIDQHAAELTPSLEVRSWFLSGNAALDSEQGGYWDDPDRRFPLQPTLFTQFFDPDGDVAFTPESEQMYWLNRALRGRLMRSETYGLDASLWSAVPYSVARSRYQVRCMTRNTLPDSPPVTMVIPLESQTLTYERIASDPVPSWAITLRVDVQGNVLESVTINGARAVDVKESDYPDTLAPGLFENAFDEQQDIDWLNLATSEIYTLISPPGEGHNWLPGIQLSSTSWVTSQPRQSQGYSWESLTASDSPLASTGNLTLTGWQRTHWRSSTSDDEVERPDRLALPAFTEIGMLDSQDYSVLLTEMQAQPAIEENAEETLKELLQQGGYHTYKLGELQLWTGWRGERLYADAERFWVPLQARDSDLVGFTQITYSSPHCLMVAAVTDAAKLTTRFDRWDWRFLTPTQITDVNDNQSRVEIDALGRTTESRFWGTEEGVLTGYSENGEFTLPGSIDEILAIKEAVPVHTAHISVTDCWMPWLRDQNGAIVEPRQRVGEFSLRRITDKQAINFEQDERQPVYVINMQTDKYDTEIPESPEDKQQQRIQVMLMNGMGGILQHAVLNPGGEALVRTPDGGLEQDAEGKAISRETDIRWAVTGKTDYDNKGNVVRSWLPFYLNDWRYIRDDSAREGIYADTHCYDATGREIKVLTAAGYMRRTGYYPWFTVSEDENDTWAEVLAEREAAGKLH